MADETLWVWPDGLHEEARTIRKAGESLRTDVAKAKDALTPGEGEGAGFAAAGSVRTLTSLWETYLSGWGTTLMGYADRLDDVADAYAKRDAEAAEALGVALPPDDPVRRRPGHSEF